MAGCKTVSVLEEAAQLIRGARAESYGNVHSSFNNIAVGWNIITAGGPITTEMVGPMMIWLKLVRESHAHKRDNFVDIAGYAELSEQICSE